MNLQIFSDRFNSLPPLKKIAYIRSNIDSLDEEEKVALLLSVIKDERTSPLVRATALKFLGNTSYQECDIFLEFYKDNHQAVAKAASKALINLKSQEKKNSYICQSVLIKMQSLKDKPKRMKMIRSMAKGKAPWIPQFLLDALIDPSLEIRDFIIKELSQRENLNLDLVHQKLTKPPWYSKSAVLQILGSRKNPASIKHIKAVLGESNVDVRRSAATALGEIGGPEALPLLVKLTKDRNPHVKIPAEEALRKASKIRFI